MKKHRNGSTAQEEEDRAAHRKKSKRQEEEGTGSEDDSSGSDGENYRSKRKRRRHHSSKREHRRRGRSSGRESEHSASSDSCSESDTEESGSQLESETSKSEDEARRRRREKRKRHEREYEERRRRKEKDRRKRRKMEKEEKMKKRKDKKKEAAKKGAVTNSWGKYGIIKEVDMWNKRPEFTAWLAEVKQVNLETLSNREEKQMFKEFMEDHNTATFPSKKYYNLDAYHRHKIEKEMKKGPQRIQEIERSVFNDEEQRRIELLRERERQKEEQVEALKRSMQGGMAQAMKEQSRLKEEMMYQYKLGNYEAAAAIQRRLDPDVAM